MKIPFQWFTSDEALKGEGRAHLLAVVANGQAWRPAAARARRGWRQLVSRCGAAGIPPAGGGGRGRGGCGNAAGGGGGTAQVPRRRDVLCQVLCARNTHRAQLAYELATARHPCGKSRSVLRFSSATSCQQSSCVTSTLCRLRVQVGCANRQCAGRRLNHGETAAAWKSVRVCKLSG